MKAFLGRMVCWVACLGVPMMLVGCGEKNGVKSSTDLGLGPTIGSKADVIPAEPVPVEGYGLVIGLPGTGSSACPPAIRAYLKRYIPLQMPERSVDVDSFIRSNTTAVVRLEGAIPAAPSKGDTFDIKVSPLPGSGTVSLLGGWLPKAELPPKGAFGGAVKPLATVEGGVYVDMIGRDEPVLTEGYVLGGAIVQEEHIGILTLKKADYEMASGIRNRLSERYGPRTARSVSPGIIELTIPPEYQRRKQRFLAMVSMTFLAETAQTTPARIDGLLEQLAVAEDKELPEIALEALGRDCLAKLRFLLNSIDEEVRFRAARCMLYLHDDTALGTLRTIVLDEESPYRAQAFEAIAKGAQRNDAALLARNLLRDRDKDMVLAAYEFLRQAGDSAVEQIFIGRSFYLERVRGAGRKAVFVARSGVPRVVIFGGPLTCRDTVFVESAGGRVVVNSRAGEPEAHVMSKSTESSGLAGPVKTSLVLAEMIRVMASERRRTAAGGVSGLGVPYSDVVAIIERLCAKDALPAEFWAGPLPKIGPIVKE